MKMRFWQKTYIFTLILFLVSLNIGVLSLTVYTYQKNVKAVEDTLKAEQYYIAKSFERDCEDMLTDNKDTASPSLLMQSFGVYYGSKGVRLAFYESGKEIYSSFNESVSVPENSISHKELDGNRYIVISSTVCEGRYILLFGKNVSYLDDEFRSIMITYALTSAVVSLLLAVCLYFVLKKLSSPLEKLRKTTEEIEAGNYEVTAEELGNDEFALLSRSFNSMISKIHEQMNALSLDAERKQILIDNLAHELRTPLTSIHGYAEFLEKASTSEEKRILAAHYIMSESERLQKISEILLDSAYIRGAEPEMKTVDVAAVLLSAAESLRPKAEAHGVEILTELCPLYISGNETLLSMLFCNLAENAVKASSRGGRIFLSISDHTVTVADNGKGMTEEQLLHITEPFYRTDKARSRADGGAGLGLALSKQIAEVHGAELAFKSRLGEGTKVFVTFTALK